MTARSAKRSKSDPALVVPPATPAPDPHCLRLRGVRQNNLKGFDLDLPLGKWIVITGLSGSGKSSLGFETLYAEGQRRYIETFSPYARQFFDRMDKPAVDRIENIPPAIALEQRNSVRTTRSTIGTMTEICDHMKVLWSHLAQLHCRLCAKPVRKDSPQSIWVELESTRSVAGSEVLVVFELPLSERMNLKDQLGLVLKQGFQRIWLDGRVLRVEEVLEDQLRGQASLAVIQDRVRVVAANRQRFVEACEQAFHFGKGRLIVHPLSGGPFSRYSSALHCAACDIAYREPSPALFSYNHPLGACPTCRGFGRIIDIDYNLVMPDHSLTLAQGAVKPWQTGVSAECQADMVKMAKKRGIPMDVPFSELDPKWQTWVVDGDPGYVVDDPEKSWPKLWYGVKGYFRWLESKSYKMHVRVLLSRYRSYTTCPSCRGQRFNPDSLLYCLAVPSSEGSDCGSLTLSDFYALPASEAHRLVEDLRFRNRRGRQDPVSTVLEEVATRLGYLVEVGLGYLTLDRPTRTLSGGETERVNLTTCLGTRLVNTLFVMDEPSVGLHPRDTERLIRILQRLRDVGNTVVVIEHELSLIRAADYLVDIGPGHGESGGQVVFHGPPGELPGAVGSLTADYLTGRRSIALPQRREVRRNRDGSPMGDCLVLENATANNLRGIRVILPLGRLVSVTGVSGSGKSTLVREVLVPTLHTRLGSAGVVETEEDVDPDSDEAGSAGARRASVSGYEGLGGVVLVDQSSLGKTPRSNPAVYVGAFDAIRDLFAGTPEAKERGLNSSAFSFNSAVGQCGRCRGAGFEKIEMQFLSDVFVRCPECHGRRYRPHILDVRISPPGALENEGLNWSIADFLEAPIDSSVEWLARFPGSRAARKAGEALGVLREVGLGYLRAGQPINTLSGGESQRLKLASFLANAAGTEKKGVMDPDSGKPRPQLFVFDEPTTGLHVEDVRVLLMVFQRMVEQGHTVAVIEHNLDVIRASDWVVDLGPEAGEDGGTVVVAGTPEEVAACNFSHTGRFLRESGLLAGAKNDR